MIKGLIVTDLDGTLLDKSGRYSLYTRKKLLGLKEKGYAIIIASGRPYRSMKDIYEDLGCASYLIAYNGELVFNPSDAKAERIEAKLNKDAIKDIFLSTKSYIRSFMAETDEKIFIDKENPYLYRYFPKDGMALVKGDFDKTIDGDLYTCLFAHSHDVDGKLKATCESHAGIGWRSWRASDHSELYAEGFDKGYALNWIVSRLGLSKNDIIAFGDADNDMTMLEEAGRAFVMKNTSSPILKSRFPITKYPVEEDGVIRQLEELGLI